MNLLRRPVHPDEPEARRLFAAGAPCTDEKSREPSIWVLELPATSYYGPLAAFWWVSNERQSNQ